mmetsp:Transcript_42494/g.107221  ORF Transcript_42494/g.107221 Transcript_42494/m.107221 type:complete len:250 (-) Transcript_42494:1183-1932(-)
MMPRLKMSTADVYRVAAVLLPITSGAHHRHVSSAPDNTTPSRASPKSAILAHAVAPSSRENSKIFGERMSRCMTDGMCWCRCVRPRATSRRMRRRNGQGKALCARLGGLGGGARVGAPAGVGEGAEEDVRVWGCMNENRSAWCAISMTSCTGERVTPCSCTMAGWADTDTCTHTSRKKSSTSSITMSACATPDRRLSTTFRPCGSSTAESMSRPSATSRGVFGCEDVAIPPPAALVVALAFTSTDARRP